MPYAKDRVAFHGYTLYELTDKLDKNGNKSWVEVDEVEGNKAETISKYPHTKLHRTTKLPTFAKVLQKHSKYACEITSHRHFVEEKTTLN